MIVLAAAAILAVPWYVVASKLRNPHPPRVTGHPTGLVWAGRVFTSPKEFDRWLRSRGSSLTIWQRKHPQLTFGTSDVRPATAKATAPRTARASTVTKAQAAPTTTAAAAPRAGGARTGSASSNHGLEVVLLLLGFVVAAAGLAAPALLRFAGPGWRTASFELRLAVVAVGTSLVLAAILVGGVV